MNARNPGLIESCLRSATCLLAALVIALPAGLRAAPFDERINFTQPDGKVIELHGWGDEFYAVFETLDGYTVCFDPARRGYCYAKVAEDGALASTGALVGEVDPASLGLSRGLRMSAAARAAQVRERRLVWEAGMEIEQRWSEHKAALRAWEAGDNTVLAPPSFTTTGLKVGLTLLVDFSDAPGTIPQAEVLAFCNADHYTGYGNNGSVKQYFRDNSNGLLTYSNVVTIYIRAPRPKSIYNDTTKNCGTQGNLLIKDVLDTLKALPNYATEILPAFSGLTVDANNRVVACNVFYAGDNGGVWNFGLWPHAWSLYNVGAQPLGNGRSVYRYQITNMGSSLRLGTFCHENGHLLCGFPDIYDYEGDSRGGAGGWCLMNSGGSGGNPTQICAYLKRAAGWATTVNLTSNSTLRATVGVTDTNINRFYRYQKPGVATEYYLVENRQASGRDANIPGSGVLIWHVDERGNRDNQSTNYNTSNANYEVSLIQADNAYHLQRNINSGDTRDPFYLGNSSPGYRNEFSLTSLPPARWWDGSPSGAIFSEFSANGPTMTFRVGPPEPPLTVVAMILADANGNGHVDFNETNRYWLVLRNDGALTATNVMVALSTPTPGVTVTEALASYPSVGPGALATNLTPLVFVTAPDFVCGAPIAFTALASVPGRVTTNQFIQTTGEPAPTWRGDVSLEQSIPDLSTILSTNLVSGFAGTLGWVKVSLYLTHTRDSDLVIDLIAPDGTANNLVNRRGGNGDHFGTACSPDSSRTTFDDTAALAITSGSAPFVGAFRPEGSFAVHLGKEGVAVNGPWRLRVRDAASGTTGILRCWSLELTPTSHCVDGAALPPVVSLDHPADRAVFEQGEPVLLSATAHVPDGLLSRVTFHAGDSLLAEFAAPPFEFVWTDAPAGAHRLRVRAENTPGLFAVAEALIGVREQGPMRWAGGASETWSEPFNWTHFRAPTNGEALLFAGPARPASLNDLLTTAGSLTLDGQGFQLGGGWVNLLAGVTNHGVNAIDLPLRLGASQTFASDAGELTLRGNVTNTGAVLTLGGAGDTRCEGLITGGGSVQKRGGGTVTYLQTNNYSGGTIVHEGTLALSRGGVLGSLRGMLTILAGATVRSEAADSLGTGGARANPLMLSGGTLLHTAPAPLSFWGKTVTLTGGTIAATSGPGASLDIGTDASVGNAASIIICAASSDTSVITAPEVRLAQPTVFFNVADGEAHPDLLIGAPIVSLTANSGINKSGVGALRLTGANAYQGPTLVTGGTLLVDGVLGTNQVSVGSATLGGTGVIRGRVLVNTAGTLAPGDGIGRLVISNQLQLAGRAILELAKTDSVLSHDNVAGLTVVTYGGELVVTHAGEPLEAGDSFRLFEAAMYQGSFANVLLPPLEEGLGWDLSALSLSGTVRVAALPVVVSPPTALAVLAGDPATFSVAAGGTPPLTFQWRRDGVALAGATDEIMHFPSTSMADAGLYDVVITNAVGAVTSVAAPLTVLEGSPALALGWEDGSLTLTWPPVSGLRLQSQTNAPGVGLRPLWHDVPGVTTNWFVIPVDGAAGGVFYRLFRP